MYPTIVAVVIDNRILITSTPTRRYRPNAIINFTIRPVMRHMIIDPKVSEEEVHPGPYP